MGYIIQNIPVACPGLHSMKSNQTFEFTFSFVIVVIVVLVVRPSICRSAVVLVAGLDELEGCWDVMQFE